MNRTEEDFRQFVSARMDALRGLAFLTCGDWQAAEDAVARCLAKLYSRWGKVDAPERYAARMVVRAAIDEVRRPSRREVASSHSFPEQSSPDQSDSINQSMVIRSLLSQLPPGQRAVLVLRFYEDFSVKEVAEALGLREGTVKSQAARGLATLRLLLAAHDIDFIEDLDEERNRDDGHAYATANS